MNYKRVLRKTHKCGFCNTKTTRESIKKGTKIEGGYANLYCVNCNALIHKTSLRGKNNGRWSRD